MLLDSELYKEDLERTLLNLADISRLKDKAIFITGANGLICSAVVDLLLAAQKKYNLGIKIYIATRNLEKSKARFASSENCINYIPYEAEKPLHFDESADFYIHGASPASPELFVQKPVETMMANIFGLKEILDKAKDNKARVLYVSSSEVYGKILSSEPIPENACGPIDISSPRSSYGQSKRTAETLCASYIAEFDSDIVITRPGHIYGPSASRTDKRVSSQFMYDALDGKNLVLKSKGEQLRSYTYSLDCASAIITVLLKGKKGCAYNISNPDSICSIAQMAQYFADYAGVKLQFELPDEAEKQAFNPMNNSSLESSLLEALGWRASFTKEEGFEHSIKILKELHI